MSELITSEWVTSLAYIRARIEEMTLQEGLTSADDPFILGRMDGMLSILKMLGSYNGGWMCHCATRMRKPPQRPRKKRQR